jgi:periplasmic protein TonB
MNPTTQNTGAIRLSAILPVLMVLALPSALQGDDLVVRISDADAQKAAITRASPDYPSMAKQMHVAGAVVVEAEVTTDGDVAKVQPVSGNALLSSAAVSAVKKWKFKPFTAEGKPAKAVVRLSFNFTL